MALEGIAVLLFLSAKCPCSAGHEEALKALYREFAPKGARFVGIHSNADEPAELSRTHFARAGLPFPVQEDTIAAIADKYGAIKTPHAFVLGRKGEILYQGGVDDSHDAAKAKRRFLRDALLAIERGGRPDPAEARTLGCVIKRH